MIKIWFMLMLVSAPNMPSVKYQGAIFPNEEECLQAQAKYMNTYEMQPEEYKQMVSTDVFCLPFDAFAIKGMNYKDLSFGT